MKRSMQAVLFVLGVIVSGSLSAADDPLTWPAVTNECRPWAYNWWLGSAVDEANMARELQRYRDGGLGGIHVIPIYGAKGCDDRYIEYLSPRWMAMLEYTVREAGRLGLGVDMTTGSGWCFGGPNVPKEQAGMTVELKTYNVAPGATLELKPAKHPLVALFALPSGGGSAVDLLKGKDPTKTIAFRGRDANWQVEALMLRGRGNAVKRAAPGGAGPMINPLYGAAMQHYLQRFTTAFPIGGDRPHPRAMYHDSYEYQTAWSPDLLAEFQRRRGYRLEEHLADLFADGARDVSARVKADYRETISDMLVENVFPQWVAWCRQRGMLVRDQAHGSPGNLLDLYALADIPETEMFGRGSRDPLVSGFVPDFGNQGDREVLVSKFASSAAHVAGRQRVAAETGTWMAEHFCETLEEMKSLVDLFFVAGINHVFYHGCCWSPDDATWPGWLFYASTEMNPRNAIWRDVPALNQYIARCQAVLQSGKPDNDILLYWPLEDYWHSPGRTLAPGLVVHGRGEAWLGRWPVGRLARQLWQRGYTFDYVSDRQLATATIDSPLLSGEGQGVRGPRERQSIGNSPHPGPLPKGEGDRGIKVPGGTYRVLLVPTTEHIPPATLEKILALAEGGATVIFDGKLPQDVPGLADLDRRRETLKRLLARVDLHETSDGRVRQAQLDHGHVLVGDIEPAIAQAGVARESLADHDGLLFIRRGWSQGRQYFLANQGAKPIDGWLPLAGEAAAVAMMDPMSGEAGMATISPLPPGEGQGVRGTGEKQSIGNSPHPGPLPEGEGDRGAGRVPGVRVYVQLPPGGSIILGTFRDRTPGPAWRYARPTGKPIPLAGTWTVTFLEGGPKLPKPFETTRLESWTKSGDPEAERFAGAARYTLHFDAPPGERFRLDLGRVCHSVRARLNGRDLGTLIMAPYRVVIDGLKPKDNLLEVEVTNLSANRIRDLDRRKVPWRVFNEINLVNIGYKPFDASNWPVFNSGLLGPVTLEPLEP